MWSNNGFNGPGSFQQDQENYEDSFAEDNYIPFSAVTLGQQYFQNQRPSQIMLHNLGGNQPSTHIDLQPDVGLYNEAAFTHNQFLSSDGPDQIVPQTRGIAPQGTLRPTLNARAEFLKAQLIKSKERAKSGTPPVGDAILDTKTLKAPDVTSSSRESPNTAGDSSESRPTSSRRPSSTVEDDLNDLISEAKAAASTKKERIQSHSTSRKPQSSPKSDMTSTPHAPTKISPTKVKGQSISPINSYAMAPRKIVRNEETNGDFSDASDGEILEDPRTTYKNSQPVYLKETQSGTNHANKSETTHRIHRNEENFKGVDNGESHGTSPCRIDILPGSREASLRTSNEPHKKIEETPERRPYSNDRYERRHLPESDQKAYMGRDYRDKAEDHHKHQATYEREEEEAPSQKPALPTLAQLLPADEDLRDWLEITGYHNIAYRNKTLNRRRAIAALDAQKAKLLEEMEMEERGGLPLASSILTSTAGMLPPPLPSKMGIVAAPAEISNDVPGHKSNDHPASNSSEPEMGIKRSYAEYHGSRNDDGHGSEKVSRIDKTGRGVKVKSENHTEARRSSSSGHNSPRHRSPSPGMRTLRSDGKEAYGERGGRDVERPTNPQRDNSPGKQTYGIGPRSGPRKFEFPPSDEYQDRIDSRSRPFVHRGNYRGRAYDPNYKSRGRGRSIGNELGEGRFEPRQTQNSDTHGRRIEFVKPYRDRGPLNRGGKGETKYFIVKSFNEENVVRCIEDSIWTTQRENGEVFKTAFLECKNVILVFSINQSRAFQGYARMESIPGSEESPHWQNNINWESAGAFRVKWLCIASTRFHRVGHLRNRLNENQPVLIGRDGQEIEERCGEELVKLIDEEAGQLLAHSSRNSGPNHWDD